MVYRSMNPIPEIFLIDPQVAYGTRNCNDAFARQGAIGGFFAVGFRYRFRAAGDSNESR